MIDRTEMEWTMESATRLRSMRVDTIVGNLVREIERLQVARTNAIGALAADHKALVEMYALSDNPTRHRDWPQPGCSYCGLIERWESENPPDLGSAK